MSGRRYSTGPGKPALLLAVLVTLSFTLKSTADSDNGAHRVESPAYGEALYEFFQENDLKAITRLMVADQRAQERRQADQSDLLLADLYYRYGLYSESNRLFTRLLSEDIDKTLLNRVWFNLARLNHEQGNEKESLELLLRIEGSFPSRLEDEKQYLLNNLLINSEDLDGAAKTVRSIDSDSVWYQYARYNLGIGLIRNNQLEKGRILLEEIGKQTAFDEEILALRDQANLSLGLALLRKNQPEDALDSFQRIRLEGPLSRTALLATGWAWAKLKQSNRALLPWLELANKNSIDAATHEALLAIPKVLEESEHRPTLAIQYYKLATEQFDRQIERLDESVVSIDAGELISLLYQNALVYDNARFAASALQASSAPYLHFLIASAPFHRELKRYQQLVDINATLNHWNLNLPTLNLMLQERRRRFIEKQPLLEEVGDFENLRKLSGARDELTAKLRHIEQNDDTFELAGEIEKDQLERLDQVAERIEKIGERMDTSEEQDKHRLLRGLLSWQINTSHAPRLRLAKKRLGELDAALSQAESHVNSLQQISRDGTDRFDQYEERIKSQQQKITALVERVIDLIDRQERQINRLAIATIEAQKQHIIKLRLNARYSLAKLYDRVVNE